MADEKQPLKASCHCGNFNIQIPVTKRSLPLQADICHCNRCRRTSGSLCNTYLPLVEQGFRPGADIIDRLRSYKSSEKFTRYFCGTCGCHVLTHGPKEGAWDVTTGCLNQLEGNVQFPKHCYIEDTIDGGCSDWITGESLKRYATRTDEVEPGWRAVTDQHSTESPSRLHAHCLCGGISIFIARPPPRFEQSQDVQIPENCGSANLIECETWWLRAHKQKFLGSSCVCDSCRLVNGFECIQWVFIPKSDISLDAEGKVPFSTEFGTLKIYRSSDEATRSFCGTCGATVFYGNTTRPGLMDLAAGLLDAPEGARAESWIEWATERVSYEEDAEVRASWFIETLKRDFAAWGKNVQGREGPIEAFLEAAP